MKKLNQKMTSNQEETYVSPVITVISIGADVITLSHSDPNMGEWDTEV